MPGFASRLREIRKDKQLRQKDLAAALGLAQTTIANYEQSTRFPDEPTLSRIADFFGVSMDYLLARSDQRNPPQSAASHPEARPALSSEATQFLSALLAGERERARVLVEETAARLDSIEEIYNELFQPVLYEVGHLWETAEIDVFAEHFVSEAIESIMGMLSARFPAPTLRYTVVGVVCGGEQHKIGLRMVLDFLALAGWNTRFLGTNLPTPSVIRALIEAKAELLAVSVTMAYNRNQASDLVRAVRQTPELKNTRVMVGGRALNQQPDQWREMNADGFARDASDAVEIARSLVS